MEACIDDVFKEIAEGLEVHVDQSQLEEKMRGAVSAPPNTTWVAFFKKGCTEEVRTKSWAQVESIREEFDAGRLGEVQAAVAALQEAAQASNAALSSQLDSLAQENKATRTELAR